MVNKLLGTDKAYVKPTIGEYLDHRIANARKNLESLCILKAKAEAQQILNIPAQFLSDLVLG